MAWAQDVPTPDGAIAAPGKEGTVEEVIVTARRRAEALQDVPLAITVFSNDAIEKKNVDSAMDLAKFTPNFHFYSANGRQDTSSLFMRGLNPNTTDTRYQNVTFFLDGVPLSGSVMGLPTANISQIEIIKGPQSATFGRATYSGAVNYITVNPTPTGLEGRGRLRYMQGDTDPSVLAALSVQFPVIADKVWAELSGSFDRKGAIMKDPATGAEIGRTQTRDAGILVYAEPTDRMTIKARLGYQREDDSTPALIQQGPRQWAQDGVLITLPSGLLWSSELTEPRDVAGCAAQGRGKPSDCGTTRTRYFGSLIATYDLGGGWSADYRGGYGYQRAQGLNDLWYSSTIDPLYPDVPTPNKGTSSFVTPGGEFESVSHQAQLLSPSDRNFRWRVGLGYFYESAIPYQTIGPSTLASAANPEGQRGGKLWSRNYSVFAGLDWNIIAPLTLSLEGRLERETIALDSCTVCFYYKDFDSETSETNFLPRVTLKYDLTADNSIYGLYALGTRPPRYNDTQPPLYPLAEAETLNNYELGTKNYFLDRRLMLNVATFFQKLENQQFRTIVPGTSQQSIQNVASSEVWGFEVESSLRVMRGLTLSGAVGYADHEYTSSVSLEGTGASTTNLFPPGKANVLGLTSYNTPKWNGNASVEYRRDVLDGFELVSTLDYIYTGEQWADLANVQKIAAAHIFNGRIALEGPAYTLSVFGLNLTDDNTPTGANLGNTRTCLFLAPEYAGQPQACNVAGMRRPREFGVELSVKF